MNFFKAFFASCLGTVAALALLILLCFGMIAVLSGDGEVAIADNSVLRQEAKNALKKFIMVI